MNSVNLITNFDNEIDDDDINVHYNSAKNTETNKLAYEELVAIATMVKQYNDENTPPQDTEWKSTGWEYDFDDTYIHIEEKDFINQSETNMEKVGIDIKYDDNTPTYDKNDIINNTF